MKKILFLFVLCFACKGKTNDNSKIVTIKTFCRYYEDDLNHKGEFNISKEIKTDSLNIVANFRPDTVIFIYKMANNILKPDTLIINKNTFKLNKKSLKILDSKDFIYKNKEIKIFKCDYVENRNGFPIFHNIFVNDSLGIIMRRELQQRSGVYEYGPNNDELHKEIKKDSIFFGFK